MDAVEVKSHELCMDTLHDLGAGKVSEAGLDEIARLPHDPGDETFCTKLNKSLMKLEGDPIFSMLELQLNPDETLADLFKAIKAGEGSEYPNSQVKFVWYICDPLSENPAHCTFYENRDKTGNRYTNV